MNRNPLAWVPHPAALSTLVLLPVLAWAQPDPADPAAPAPAPRYVAPLRDYKPWQDLAPRGWAAAATGAPASGAQPGTPARPASAPAHMHPHMQPHMDPHMQMQMQMQMRGPMEVPPHPHPGAPMPIPGGAQ